MLFLSRFFVSLKSLNSYFFRRFAYKSLLDRLPVLIMLNYIMWSSNHFSTSSCFPHFSGSRFFRVQIFHGPRPGFRSSPILQHLLRCSWRAAVCCMKQQVVPFLYASISLAYFEAKKGFLSIVRLNKKYTMLIKKRVYLFLSLRCHKIWN